MVVDVYSEWSGPCSAMTNFLKKIKLEVNDDLLHYAMAKSDTIPQLEVFRGHCKPTWLFMSGGEPVAVMHGANAPLLQKMIEKEIRRERQVMKGEAVREAITYEDAVPGNFSFSQYGSKRIFSHTYFILIAVFVYNSAEKYGFEVFEYSFEEFGYNFSCLKTISAV